MKVEITAYPHDTFMRFRWRRPIRE